MENITTDYARRDFDRSHSRRLVDAVCKGSWQYMGAVEITDPADDLIEMDFYAWVIRDEWGSLHYFTTDHGQFMHINAADLDRKIESLPSHIRRDRYEAVRSFHHMN